MEKVEGLRVGGIVVEGVERETIPRRGVAITAINEHKSTGHNTEITLYAMQSAHTDVLMCYLVVS